MQNERIILKVPTTTPNQFIELSILHHQAVASFETVAY